MKSLSSVGLGLSVVFGCLLLALVAELYYLLWWKKRITRRDIESDYSNPATEFLYMFCWRRPSSLSHTALNPQELCSSVRITDTLVQEPHSQNHLHSNNKDFLLKPFGDDDSMETELMRLHNLSGPPRFLFTIIEETKEDLESEDAKSRCDNKSRKGSRSRSLSDLLLTVETPYLTPLASPPFFTPPLTPMNSSYNQHGFNPLYESSTDAEFSKIRASPPPKFKFLQDADEKLYRRKLKEEAEKKAHRPDGLAQENGLKAPTSKFSKDEDDGSFITIIVDKNKEKEHTNQHNQLPPFHSSSSQVLPLASSPSTFRSPAKKNFVPC
ncbi:Transmembrane protein [Melia azedarach]|uniref:Transmembrane protein n=1 Tax=Melia azedarach TaxID=155640 RepID=A0ACC1Y7X2_MELAZ|nr:Transmembrane protein [Melia azedarach]